MRVRKVVELGKLSLESDGLESCSREKDVAPFRAVIKSSAPSGRFSKGSSANAATEKARMHDSKNKIPDLIESLSRHTKFVK